MDLFGMGIGEILLVLLVAVMIWGPGRLPEIARTLGKWVSTFRKASLDLTTQMKKELEEEEKKLSEPEPKADTAKETEEPADANGAEDGSTTTDNPEDR